MSFPVVAGFILAAGEGRRLRPATLSRPKALIPFCGVPMLELVASQFQPLPLRAVVVNAWYLADQVEAACRALAADTQLDLRVSREARLLDTGGGLRYGARLVPEAEHFLVHNADVVLDYDLRQLLARHVASGAAATVLQIGRAHV
jgi:NDP-sugar pyrophosphorylase family protein